MYNTRRNWIPRKREYRRRGCWYFTACPPGTRPSP